MTDKITGRELLKHNISGMQIGNLKTRIPIIQGGMGVGISLSGLASAVANEGGIGVISASGIGMHEPDFNTNLREANKRALVREIKKAREKTAGVIGVNLLVALTDYFELIEIAVEEGIDAVFLGAGLPLKVPDSLIPGPSNPDPPKVIPIVSSARSAKIIFTSWARHYNHVPDALVVEGPLAGGHLGYKREQIEDPDFCLEKTLHAVLEEVKPFEEQFGKKIPVIAAGGVYSGEDIYRLMQLGAHGVQMATRFVATFECDASPEFKKAYLDCKIEDLAIIDSPVGLPGRAIMNGFLEKVKAGLKKPIKCPWTCLRTCDIKKSSYCICAALTNAKKGLQEKGFAFAGANAYRINKITSVKELIDSLLAEYRLAVAQSVSVKVSC